MSTISVLTAILTLISGIGVFLIACGMMSSNLESLSSGKLKKIFSKASKSKLLGVSIGTVAIQSSGATTVMVVGFVNAGIMTLTQAATMIYGANIGTTITAQIVALGMFGGSGISTTVIFSAFTGVGALIMLFSKKDLHKKIGGILTGFGMLFIGLSMMSSSMENFAAMDAVKSFLAQINNVVILVIIGAALTAVIQSSSVMTSITITMLVSDLISLEQGISIAMGANIGACIVGIIASMRSSCDAKRAAMLNVVFNICKVTGFVLIEYLIRAISGGIITYGWIFERLFPFAPQTQLAMFHTIFNIVTVILALPMTALLVRSVTRLMPEKDAGQKQMTDAPHLYYIDEHMLKTPYIAVRQVKKEIINMAKIAMDNFNISLDFACNLDYSGVDEFKRNENELNYLNKSVMAFIVKLNEATLNEKNRIYLSTAFYAVADLERVGDYAENIVEYADSLKNLNTGFSQKAIQEISEIREQIDELFKTVVAAYKNDDIQLMEKINMLENGIDSIVKVMSNNHIERLQKGVCDLNAGAQFLSLISNAERIADHFVNIANGILSYA